jgi:membrane protein DedA with SNARE-associated domain
LQQEARVFNFILLQGTRDAVFIIFIFYIPSFASMFFYLIVFVASFIVDLIPAFGPPAWSVMVFMQVKFGLKIWWVLLVGVLGSTVGRYMLSRYIVPVLSDKLLKKQKKEDIEFLGEKLNKKGWQSFFVVLAYTLVPIPTAPLFTVAGIAKIKPLHIIPPFFIGKFTSDALVVFAGKYASENYDEVMQGLVSWQSILTFCFGLVLISILLFIDWRALLMRNKVRLNFQIWK